MADQKLTDLTALPSALASGDKIYVVRSATDYQADQTDIRVAVASQITGLGTGVATALAVNVGSAGAPVVNGGALGTPASGTLTNCTGLPEAGLSFTDLTTANASTTAHGLLLKATAPASGIRNVVAIDNGETVYKNTALFDTTNPAALGVAAPGTSLIAARRDHVHTMPVASDLGLGTGDSPQFTAVNIGHASDTTVGRSAAGVLSIEGVAALGGAEATVASATTTDIGAAAAENVSITGTTTITGFGTVAAGTKRQGRFTGALTLTHNATSLILPGGANITTAAGDRFGAVSLGSGNWVVYWYTKANGTSIIGGKTLARFIALDNNPPASNYATLDTRNSLPVLDFDDGSDAGTTDEAAIFLGSMPEDAALGSGLTVYIHWAATTATSGDVIWEVSLARLNANNQDLDGYAFDTATLSSASTANGTCGKTTTCTITVAVADTDSIAAGDPFAIKVIRKESNGSDTMAGDAELLLVEVRSAA